MAVTEQQQRDTERWFVARGVPHLIADYRATEDVLTRALPVLTLIFVSSSVAAVDLDWPAVGIGFAVVGGVAILIGAWALLNRWRGIRPLLSRPRSVGLVEIGAFVMFPSALPIIFGADWAGAVWTFITQVVLLTTIYVVTSYGLVAISRWAAGQLVRSLTETFALFARGLPLLLLGFMFLFINAEAWQAAGQLELELLAAIIVLFLVLGSVFVVSQIPREIRPLPAFESWQQIEDLAGDSPMAGTPGGSEGPPEPDPLSPREWANLGLVVLVSQGLRILLVSVLVGGFFVVFGLLIIRQATIGQWIGEDPELMWRSFEWFGLSIQMTEELLQVSAFLAAFAGLYFSVYTITDATFRAQFFEDIVDEVRESLAVRALYRLGSST